MNSKMPGPIFVSSKSDSDTIIWISADTDTDCCAALLCFETEISPKMKHVLLAHIIKMMAMKPSRC